MADLDAIKSGDDRVVQITTTWPHDVPSAGAEAGDPYPLDGKTIWFTAKRNMTDLDVDAVFQKTTETGGGIEVDATDTNIAYVTIDSSDTANIESSGLYCDLQVKNEAGKVFTVWDGLLPVLADVTQSTTI
jgi:hypothetical protein